MIIADEWFPMACVMKTYGVLSDKLSIVTLPEIPLLAHRVTKIYHVAQDNNKTTRAKKFQKQAIVIMTYLGWEADIKYFRISVLK